MTLIESLGNIRFAYLDSAATDDPLIVQLAPGERLAEQEKVTLAARPEACHLFDARRPRLPARDGRPGLDRGLTRAR